MLFPFLFVIVVNFIILEADRDGNIIRSFILSNIAFEKKEATVDEGYIWTYNTTLGNRANVIITVSINQSIPSLFMLSISRSLSSLPFFHLFLSVCLLHFYPPPSLYLLSSSCYFSMTKRKMRWFNIAGSLTFADTTTSMPPNSLKMNVEVKNWDFESITNVLNLIFDAKDVDNAVGACNVKSQSDSSNNLYSYTIST